MNMVRYFLWGLIMLMTSSAYSDELAPECAVLDLKTFDKAANALLRKNGLIGKQEVLYTNGITSNKNLCFLILSSLPSELTADVEILAYEPTKKKLDLVEKFVPAPKRIQVAIGLRENENYYYVELSGKSAIAAYKSVLAKYPVNGLSACVDAKIDKTEENILPTGKAAFDPTANRTWKLKSVQFNLRRGNSNEVDDIYSYQLDKDFRGFLYGSLPCLDKSQSRGQIQPWTSSIQKYKATNGQWMKVQYDTRFTQIEDPGQPTFRATHEVLFKTGMGDQCLPSVKSIAAEMQPITMEPFPEAIAALIILPANAQQKLQQLRKLSCVKSVLSL